MMVVVVSVDELDLGVNEGGGLFSLIGLLPLFLEEPRFGDLDSLVSH